MPLVPTPRRDLISAGATASQLNGDLRMGRSVALFRGVHVDSPGADSFRVRVRAAVATQSSTAVVGMQTSAVLNGLRWVPEAWSSSDAEIQLAVEQGDKRRDRRGIKLHRRELSPGDIVLIDGIACMSPTRSLVELARDPKLAGLLVVQLIDGALRDERTSKQDLLACVARFAGQRGVARARHLIGRAREGVDSPQETKTRLLLEHGGVTELDVNIKLLDDEGFLLARGDLGIKRLLIWGEYDGFVPHSRRETFRSDRAGDRWLSRRGWHVMRFTDEDLARPGQTCREWLSAIADTPARIRALDPRRSPEIAEAWSALGFS